ncbi:MAG: MMPL family transporter [Acidobacteria bacterium]|nr:MMPL family transporter [Acidobacteriota bacterium]
MRPPSRERLFSEQGFAFLDKVSGDIERVQAVLRVSSLATATVVDVLPSSGVNDDGGLQVRRLIEDLETKSPGAVGQRAMDDELFRGDLISEDGTVTALILFFDEARIDDVRAEVLTEIRRLVDAVTHRIQGALQRQPRDHGGHNRVTLANQTTFTPPILALTLLALFVMFRSVKKTLLTFGAILVSLLWTLGLYDLFGFSYNVLSSMIIPLVVVLAVADDVHILQHYGLGGALGAASRRSSVPVRHLMAPLFGASATTALGMLSLATSQVVAVREFGMGAAIGVMVDFAISIILVPTMLGWVKEERVAAPQESWFLGPLRSVAMFSTRHARAVMAVVIGLVVLAGVGMSRLRVDTNHINFFSERHELYTSAQVMDKKLAGIYTFQVFLEGAPESMQQPDILKRMDRLSTELKALPFVRKVTSVADYVKRVHRELNDGRQEAFVIPETSSEVAQELLVFGLGDEGGRNWNAWRRATSRAPR